MKREIRERTFSWKSPDGFQEYKVHRQTKVNKKLFPIAFVWQTLKFLFGKFMEFSLNDRTGNCKYIKKVLAFYYTSIKSWLFPWPYYKTQFSVNFSPTFCCTLQLQKVEFFVEIIFEMIMENQHKHKHKHIQH